MKELVVKTVLAIAFGASTASAATSATSSGPGYLVWAFLGFFAAIIIMQLLPGIALFIGMVRALFARSETKKPLVGVSGKDGQ